MKRRSMDVAREPAESLRIVIGENNADLAMTVSLLLGAEPDMCCVATAASGSAVLATLDEHAPNAFMLDLSLDDGPSLPLIATLRARVPQAAIIVFTGYQNDVARMSNACGGRRRGGGQDRRYRGPDRAAPSGSRRAAAGRRRLVGAT